MESCGQGEDSDSCFGHFLLPARMLNRCPFRPTLIPLWSYLQFLQARRRCQPGKTERRICQAVRAVGQAVQESGHRGSVVSARIETQSAGGWRQQAGRVVVSPGRRTRCGPGGLRGLRLCQGR